MDEMRRITTTNCRPGSATRGLPSLSRNSLAGAEAPVLVGLSILVVFLCLAALYESWATPIAVLLIVPVGLFGAIFAAWVSGLPNDVFFKVGIITIIGLAAKNAILIVEFALDEQKQGKPLYERGGGGRATAPASDPHDLVRLHPGRHAAGACHRRGRQCATRHRHRRGGRHVVGGDTRRVAGAGFLRVVRRMVGDKLSILTPIGRR